MALAQILAHGAGDLGGFLLVVAPTAILLGLGIMLIFPKLGSGYAQRRYEDFKPEERAGNGNGGDAHPSPGDADAAKEATSHRRGNGSEARRKMYGTDPDA